MDLYIDESVTVEFWEEAVFEELRIVWRKSHNQVN